MKSPTWVLGIAASHNGAACLLRDDEIVAAVQEERLTRQKRQTLLSAYDSFAVKYCLDAAGIQVKDLDMVVSTAPGTIENPRDHDLALNPQLRLAHHGIPFFDISHHLAHAISAFATSGFSSAAVLVADGCGSDMDLLTDAERATVLNYQPGAREVISLYLADGTGVAPLEKQCAPVNEQWLNQRTMARFFSLGDVYSSVGQQVFGDLLDGPGKVMGLAPYGQPTTPVEDWLHYDEETGLVHFHDTVLGRFRHAERWPKRSNEYADLAASAQKVVEETLLKIARRLRRKTGQTRLCYAGGVALNSVANERLVRESGFSDLYIIPAAEDSGTAIGAAYWGRWQLSKKNANVPLRVDAVGKFYSAQEIERAIQSVPATAVVATDDFLDHVAQRIAAGQVFGCFQGRSELGPRALGQRSILCDPRPADMKDKLNVRVKFREPFRPFAPIILEEAVHDWFDVGDAEPRSPFMLRVWKFRAGQAAKVPAVAHVDGTGRVQTVNEHESPFLYRLLQRFERQTGVPILLNTSFNIAGEPIVETPEDALWCMLCTGIDFCGLGERVVERCSGFKSLLELRPTVIVTGLSAEAPVIDGKIPANWNDEFRMGMRTPLAVPYSALAHIETLRAKWNLRWLRAAVNTPWGPITQILETGVRRVLAEMDGRRTGFEVLRALRATGLNIDEMTLLRQLISLRAASVISLN